MTETCLRVAVLQMQSGDNLPQNLQQAERLIAEAAQQGAQLLVLPENFALFGCRDQTPVQMTRDDKGPVAEFLRTQTRLHNVWLLAGTLPYSHGAQGHPAAPDRVFAGSGLWNACGEPVGRYDKCHLFDVDIADGVGRYRESDTYCAGEGPLVLETPWGGLGMSVCYDLRFPEYYRLLANLGAKMVAVPSAFVYRTGEAHWEVLLRARAIENQCFMLAANQGGRHAGERQTWGHSCIVDPWGTVLALCPNPGPAVAIADLDFGYLDKIRRTMPVLHHRRF